MEDGRRYVATNASQLTQGGRAAERCLFSCTHSQRCVPDPADVLPPPLDPRGGPFRTRFPEPIFWLRIDKKTKPNATIARNHQPREMWAPLLQVRKGKGSPNSITERRFPQLIPVLGSQPAGDLSHKPGGRLSLLSARPAVTSATLKRAASNFAAW